MGCNELILIQNGQAIHFPIGQSMALMIRFQVKNELLLLLSGADIPFVEGTVTIH